MLKFVNMVHSVHEYEDLPEKPKYLPFPCVQHETIVDGRQVLNRWSTTITRGQWSQQFGRLLKHANLPRSWFPWCTGKKTFLHSIDASDIAWQAMLYAAGVPNREMMKTAPQVGIATVWWEGNPCSEFLLVDDLHCEQLLIQGRYTLWGSLWEKSWFHTDNIAQWMVLARSSRTRSRDRECWDGNSTQLG